MVKRNRMRRSGSGSSKKRRLKAVEMKSVIKPTEVSKYDTSPAQRYVLSRHPKTRHTDIRSLAQLRKVKSGLVKKENAVHKEIQNNPTYKKNQELGDKHYKAQENYRKLRDKEKLKAHRKFFRFDSVWDSHYDRKESMWMKAKVERELENKFPNAREEELKEIAFKFSKKYRDTKTKYKEYDKLMDEHDKKWSEATDKERKAEHKIMEKHYGHTWWGRIRAYDLQELEKEITDREDLRRAYNKYKARERKLRKIDEEHERRISVITSDKTKDVYEKLVG